MQCRRLSAPLLQIHPRAAQGPRGGSHYISTYFGNLMLRRHCDGAESRCLAALGCLLHNPVPIPVHNADALQGGLPSSVMNGVGVACYSQRSGNTKPACLGKPRSVGHPADCRFPLRQAGHYGHKRAQHARMNMKLAPLSKPASAGVFQDSFCRTLMPHAPVPTIICLVLCPLLCLVG